MNENTAGTSQGFGRRRVCWVAAAAYVAMACTLACSGGAGDDRDDDSTYDAEPTESVGDSNVQDEAGKTEKKALFRNAVLDASPCQNCTTKEVCTQKLVPCDPPVFVNGRQIMCLEEVCRDEVVCTPCGAEGQFDDLSEIDPAILGGLGGISPIDPLPVSF